MFFTFCQGVAGCYFSGFLWADPVKPHYNAHPHLTLQMSTPPIYNHTLFLLFSENLQKYKENEGEKEAMSKTRRKMTFPEARMSKIRRQIAFSISKPYKTHVK